ncbi:hypothetical protein [Burkholderia pseudomallei]|uniref:hypothetical protein n=1 Tax=Burkholderia pseudomallei TaxID=28450 RepID=UPI0010A920D4|nr:hypothetical protein [Burkholderia pseudomallei]MBF3932671.1 hypothetical protein [Burkholderia pseudomallei]
MSFIIVHRADDPLELKSDGSEKVLFDKPIEIILWPQEPPPGPMVVLNMKHSSESWRASGPGDLLLRLDKAIDSGRLTDNAKADLLAKAKGLQPGETLTVDAHLPAGHAIDAGLLSRHVSHFTGNLGHPVVLNIWSKVASK